MMHKTLPKTSLSLAVASLLGMASSTAFAAPGIALDDYSLTTGDSVVVTLSLDDTGTTYSNTSEVDIGGTLTNVSNDKLRADNYALQIYRIGKKDDDSIGQVYVGGLDDQLTGTRASSGPNTLTITTTDQLTTGLYQIKACQGGTLQLDHDNDGGTATQDSAVTCANDPDASFTTFTVKPAAATGAKIALLDNFLTRAALETAGTGSVATGDVSLTQEMGFSASRNALATAAWLSSLDSEDYKFDVLSSQDIEASDSLDNYDVLIVSDRNAVWTSEMRATLDGFLGNETKGVLFLGADNLTHNATVDAGDANIINVTADGSQAVTGLDSAKGGTIGSESPGAFTVNNADHWAYTGLTLDDGDTFGGNSDADKRIVGALTDGATVTATNGVPATSFNVGSSTYEVIAYMNTGDSTDENFAVPGVFKSDLGGWVFNAATLRWAEGLNDLSANFVDPEDATPQTITKNVIDVFLSGGAVDTDNDGIIDFYDDNPNLNPNDTDGDGVLNSVDNCSGDANADQTDTDEDGMGDACDTQNDTDTDGDTVIDINDNCKDDANTDQADNDEDGVGNVCDTTPDGDTTEEETEEEEETTSSGGGGSTGLAFLLPLIGLAGFRRKH